MHLMIRSKELDRRKSFPSALHRAGDAYLVKRGEGKKLSPVTPGSQIGAGTLLSPFDHRCHEGMGHCRPIPWRASAPSAPWNDANLRPATAARDRSPPGPHRSSLPRPHGPLPADSLEGVRSVGAV